MRIYVLYLSEHTWTYLEPINRARPPIRTEALVLGSPFPRYLKFLWRARPPLTKASPLPPPCLPCHTNP